MARRRPMLPYVFPLVGEYHYTRTDQGVDYAPSGPTVLRAIGKAKILATHPPPGWPEGGGILYKLLEGPLKGKIIYTYEGVDAASYLKPGEIVRAGQPIGKLREGGSIEMGFADAAGETIAHDKGQTAGRPANENTPIGLYFKKILGHIPNSPAAAGQIKAAPSLLEELGGQLTKTPGEIAGEAGSRAGEAAGGIAGDVAGALGNLFGEHAEALALNIALLVGAAFLIYYGAALMLGVRKPVATPLEAGAKLGAKAAAA